MITSPQTSLMDIPPKEGYRQSVDDARVPANSLLAAENIRTPKIGCYSKRHGVGAYARTLQDGTSLSGVGADLNEDLATNDAEVVLSRPEGLRTYEPTYGRLVKRGTAVSHYAEELAVARGTSNENTEQDTHNLGMARGGGYTAFVWSSMDDSGFSPPDARKYASRKGISSFVVVDDTSGATVFTGPLRADVDLIRVVYLSTYNIFVVVFSDGEDIIARTFRLSNPTDPLSYLAEQTLVTRVGGSYSLFDVCECENEGGYFYLAYQRLDGGPWPIEIRRVTPTGSPAGTTYSTTLFAQQLDLMGYEKMALSVAARKGRTVVVVGSVWNPGTSKEELWFFSNNETSGAVVATTMMESALSTTSNYLTSGICFLSNTTVAVAYTRFEYDNTRLGSFVDCDYGPCTFVATVATSGVVTRYGVQCGTPWTILHSRPFLSDSKVFAWLSSYGPGTTNADNALANPDSESFNFSTLVLCDLRYDQLRTEQYYIAGLLNAGAQPVASLFPWYLLEQCVLPKVAFTVYKTTTVPVVGSGGVFQTAAAARASGDTYHNVFRITSYDGTAWSTKRGVPMSQPLSNGLIYGGGLPCVYDGQQVVENGFLNVPWTFSFAEIVAGGTLPAGDYRYKYCYVGFLRDGSVVRSPLSLPTAALTSTGTEQVNLRIPMPGLSKWYDPVDGDGFASGLQIEVYRSVDGSTEFTLFARIPTMQYNPYQTAIFNDDGSASSLGLPEPSSVDPAQPPSFAHHIVLKNRVFGIHGDTVWFTSFFTKGQQPFFSLDFTQSVLGEELTAIGGMDDKLLVFSADKVFWLPGNGPTNLNTQSDYSGLLPVSTDVGCIEASSIVSFSGGVLFRSRGGLCMVDRSLSVTPVGMDVQDLLPPSAVITSAYKHPTEKCIFFCVKNGSSQYRIVYDYQYQSLFKDTFSMSGGGPIRASVAGGSGNVYTLHSDGIYLESTSVFYDTQFNATKVFVSKKASSGLLASSGPQGWQRSREVNVAFRRKSACGATAKLYVGHSSTVDTNEVITESEVTAYSVGEYFERQVSFTNPEAQGGRIELYETAPASISDSGEGLDFLGFLFNYEPQGGASRKAQNQLG